MKPTFVFKTERLAHCRILHGRLFHCPLFHGRLLNCLLCLCLVGLVGCQNFPDPKTLLQPAALLQPTALFSLENESEVESPPRIRIARPFTQHQVELNPESETNLLQALANSVHSSPNFLAIRKIQSTLEDQDPSISGRFRENFVSLQRGNSVLFIPRALVTYDPVAAIKVKPGDAISYHGIPQNDGIFPSQSTGDPTTKSLIFTGNIPEIQGLKKVETTNIIQLTIPFMNGYLGGSDAYKNAVKAGEVDTIVVTRMINGASYSYVWPLNAFAKNYAAMCGGAKTNSGWVKPIELFDGDLIHLTRFDQFFSRFN